MRQWLAVLGVAALSCATANVAPPTEPYALVLGIAQDGGYPQAGCNRPDCEEAWRDPRLRRHVASLAIIDPQSGERWIIDATPDFPRQLRMLHEVSPGPLSGILLTHAHIGHYAGLMHLGREVMGARGVAVFAMPRMRAFLEGNAPWDQLVRLGNIVIQPLEDGRGIPLNERLSVTPMLVPHRDEYSETVAFLVRGPARAVLWLPDIDKWEKWTPSLDHVLATVDTAYLDATFFDERELPGRDLREIPHPTIRETMERLASLPAAERRKVRFIHLNQSNPALRDGEARREIRRNGFDVAREGERAPL